jgi:apolipoprotein N-acyltransferase
MRAATRIAAVAGWFEAAPAWQRRGGALLAGAVSTLAFAPFFFWPVLFITFPVMVWLIDGTAGAVRPARAAAVAVWWFGFGYFFAGLLWIGEAFLVEAEIFAWLLPFAVTMLPAAMAMYWAAAAFAARLCWPVRPARTGFVYGLERVLVLAIAIGLAEWLRGWLFTGFPWNAPGLALTMPLPLMQSVRVFGVQSLTMWAVLLTALPLVVAADATANRAGKAWTLGAAFSAAPLAMAYVLGSWHLAAPPSPDLAGVRIRVVQPSVPQRDKWQGDKQAAIFQDHLDLSRRDASSRADDLAGVTHLIWPEASMPFGPLDHPEALAAIGQLLPPNVHLLAGALRQERDEAAGTRKAYNSLLVLGSGGELVGLYDKIHLVPFGEYLPFQTTLESIGLQSLTRQRGGFTPGPTPKPLLRVPGLPPVGPLICYEAIFAGEAAPGDERPGVLVIVTNDGWFGNSTGPPQHFHQARVRAVEQGLTVVRAANNGISAVIDPEGRVLASLALNARGSIDSGIPQARPPSVYARAGSLLFWVTLVLFYSIVMILRHRFKVHV